MTDVFRTIVSDGSYITVVPSIRLIFSKTLFLLLQSIVFYCVRNKKLVTWLSNEAIMSQIEELESATFVDFDTVFRPVTDKDYDLALGGVTRQSFCQSYHEWLVCCNKHRPENEVSKLMVSSFPLQ